jgi:phage baseplate assembly protein W
VINWAPTPADEVLQNVRTLLKTAPGSVPLSRKMGTPQDVVDQPQSAVGARLQADVIRAVRDFEPRASIVQVKLSNGGTDGRLIATAQLVGVAP